MRRRFIAVGLFGLLFALGWWAGRVGASNDLYARLDTFIEILHKVEENYVEPVEPEHLIRGAVHGMLRDLDPYAEFVDSKPPHDRSAVGAPSSSAHPEADVALALGSRDNSWVVIAPVAGGNAERAGVRAGDRLLQVDGRSTASWTRAEIAARLRGARGTRVRLTVLRPGEETPRDLSVARASAPRLAPLEGRLIEKGIGYVRLAAFGDSTALELRALLRRLRSEGATRLVLDLRGCTAGTVRQAADVAQLFLPRGAPISLTRGRLRDSEQKLVAAGSDPLLDWPVVLAIDAATAGAAEVVAGALQDHDRALLIGRTTFGLASVQSDFPLQGGNATVRFTTAIQLTPSGRPIQKVAQISDDDDETSTADSAATDSASRRAYLTRAGRKVLGGGGIRPDVEVAADTTGAASSNRALASSQEPAGDAVLRRALAVLRRARGPRDVFAVSSPPARRAAASAGGTLAGELRR